MRKVAVIGAFATSAFADDVGVHVARLALA
jgi:hypothetical protein